MGEPFWKTKSLSQLNPSEWESLCDGCGRCCLIKLEDEDTGKVFNTNVACRLLDTSTCRCRDYKHRLQKVKICVSLNATNIHELTWLPETCAYRRLAEGKDLENWHPLVSGSSESVHLVNISIKSFAQSEEFIHPDQLQEHVID